MSADFKAAGIAAIVREYSSYGRRRMLSSQIELSLVEDRKIC